VEARTSAEDIVALREELRRELGGAPISNRAHALLDLLFAQPLVNIATVSSRLYVSPMSAARLVDSFAERGWLREVTGNRRNRLFRFDDYLASFREVEEGEHMRTRTAATSVAVTRADDPAL